VTKSMSERLNFTAPPSGKSVGLGVRETISDIERILALPKRPPVNCERDPRTKQYPPATQALIEIMTERFSRGQRLSCACRERRVTLTEDGALIIGRVLPEGATPEIPLITTVEAFLADNQSPAGGESTHMTVAGAQAVRVIQAMKPGDVVTLPSADVTGHPCIKTLNAVQSWFLKEAEENGGVVGFCGVGSGKSIALLLAILLFSDSKKAVLLIEPKQRQHYRSQYLRLREHFRVSSLVPDQGDGYTVPGTTPLHLISYSVLSQTKNSDMLDARSPDTLLGDEFHRACGSSAINRRVKRYISGKIAQREEDIRQGKPVLKRAVRLLGASGTLESGSIEDTQMLCTFSLGTGSPIPIDPSEAQKWSAVIDPSYMPDRKSTTAKMLQRVFGDGEVDEGDLNNLLGAAPESAVRRGFKQRRLLTPGIISASASSINAAIYISERKPPKMPAAVKAALMAVRVENKRPDGEILTERIEQISCARNVACGFYNYWAFPKHPCACVEGVSRCANCTLIDDWYAKRKAFNKDLRAKLIYGELNLDSDALCKEAAERFWQEPKYKGALPTWDCQTWPAWRDIENRVEHDEREKWIENGGDFLVKDAAKWALDECKGVVWFQSIVFGRTLAELTGLPYYNGGPGSEARLRAETGKRSIICSIKAHGAGTDGLQNIFNNQLIAETPASNSKQTGYEQLLGRLHREGQPEDEVNTYVYTHVFEMKDALRKAIEQAEFNFELQGNRQKLLMADIDVEGL
jgi:hypothetical protein